MTNLSVVSNDCPVQSFKSYLTSSLPTLEFDLSEATLVQVLTAHDNMIAKRNGGKHRDKDLISWILALEDEIDETIYPIHVTAQFYDLAIQRMAGEQDLQLSTINLYLSKLKNILEWSKTYNGKTATTYKDFKPLRYNTDHVALTPDEVSHITHYVFNLDGTGKKLRKDAIKTLSKVRDMFVLQCNIGQRYSDMHVMTQDNFDEMRTRYHVTQQKTGSQAEVDLKRMTIDANVTYQILRRYNFSNPIPKMDISRFNKLLHRIFYMIGGDFLKEVTICTYKILGEIRVIKKPLYKAIASHTPRRTYITYMVNRGVPFTEIRRCSGHKSMKSFEGYIRGDHYEL